MRYVQHRARMTKLALRAVFLTIVTSLIAGSGVDFPIVLNVEALFLSPTATAPAPMPPTPTLAPTATPTGSATDTPTPPLPLTSTLAPTRTRALTFTPTASQNMREMRVPVLMYHYISIPPPDADAIRLDLSVTPQAFDEQMAFLVSNGYHTVRVADVVEHLRSGAPLPEKPIVLTFDDGYADNYKAAFPILKKYGMTATFYVIAQFTENQRPGYATWDQLREMANAGMEIGSHSMDHSDLHGRSIAFLTNQIAGSKQAIESRLGVTVKTFSYPSGKYDANTIAVVRANGYLGAVTEIQGLQQTTNDIFELRRVRIRGSYSLTDYAYWLNWFTNSAR